MKLILLIFVLLTSCAYGPKYEKKSGFDHLNGKNNFASVSSKGIPLLVERQKRETRIEGTCHFQLKDDHFKYPVKYQEVGIYKNDRLLHKVKTNHEGKFVLQAYLLNGNYTLKIMSKHYSGSSSLKINSYEHEGIKILGKKL